MTEVTTHINEDGSVRSPSLDLFFNRVYVPTDCLILAMVLHVFVEHASRVRVLHKPRKSGQFRLMGHLMDCVVIVRNVRVVDLFKKIRELLVQGTAGVESRDSVHHDLQPAQASG